MVQMKKILLVGYMTDLLEKRKECLEAASYQVTCATSFSHAFQLIEKDTFRVIILGHGVPEEERNQMARKIKQVSPATRIVMLYLASIRNAELADAIIHTTADSADLTRTIDDLIGMQSQSKAGA